MAYLFILHWHLTEMSDSSFLNFEIETFVFIQKTAFFMNGTLIS